MSLHSEMRLGETLFFLKRMSEFLHRFIHAANSHVELEPFVTEGEELLRSIEND